MILDNLIFPYDYIILTILCVIVIINSLKGIIQSILSLLTWIGSILITIYTYDNFSNFLSKQILKIDFFQQYEYLSHIISLVISIPFIFLLILFILKRIRKLLSSDLDKQIIGVLFDKIFGFIYGIVFSYVIISSAIILLDKFKINNLNLWLKENSYLISSIDQTNNQYFNISNSKEIKDF